MPDYKALGRQFAESVHFPWPVFEAQIQQESGWNPAPPGNPHDGIAQITPDTAAAWGVNPRDPVASLRAAVQHDAAYLARYGSLPHALVAYNAGPGIAELWDGSRRNLNATSRQYLDAILGTDWTGPAEGGEAPPESAPPESAPTETSGIFDFTSIWSVLKSWGQAGQDAAEASAVEAAAPWIVGSIGVFALSVGVAALVFRSPPAKLITQIAKASPIPAVRVGANAVGVVQG